MNEFFAMGGFARYVWPAYLITAFVLIVNLIMAKRKHTKLLKRDRHAEEA